MSRIPLQYPEIDEDLATSFFHEEDGVVRFTWPEAGVVLSHPLSKGRKADAKTSWYVDPHDIKAESGDIRIFEDYGVAAGNFAEFAVFEPWVGNPVDRRAWTRLGPVEASLGDPSPLMQYVFASTLYSNDLADGWYGIHTIRLFGVWTPDIERRLLQALLTFRTRLQAELRICHLSEPDIYSDPEPVAGSHELFAPEFCVADTEVLHLFYAAELADDVEFAFLQFYRVLEFYSALSAIDRLASVRWDRSLSSAEFLRQATSAVNRDERSALSELIAKTTSPASLQKAQALGLVKATSAEAFANALYDFRNSVVHAKYDMRAKMHVARVLQGNPAVQGWKELARAAASDAMRTLGERDQ
ncbi:MAG: hypothetical protein AB7S68_22210 [Polyangiaceae bacterium]